MADEIDIANAQAERWLQQSLAARAGGPTLLPKGSCYFCDAEFASTDANAGKKLFCDSDCASDYEKETRLKALR